MNKQGQTEIIGLLLLVIIAGLIFMFAISYTAGDDANKDTYRQEILAKRFVNTLATTHISTCGTSYETLVKDCASTKDITCNGNTSCEVLNHTTRYVINNTIKQWGHRYRFLIHKNMQDIYINVTNQCSGEMERAAPGVKQVPLYPSPGTAKIQLGICI